MKNLIKHKGWWCIWFAAQVAYADELMVMRSTSESIVQGPLSAQFEVHLSKGESLQLMAADGVTFELVGPYKGLPFRQSGIEIRDEAFLPNFLRLIDGLAEVGEEMGAVRGNRLATMQSPPSIWMLNLNRSGPHCLLDSHQELVLWSAYGAGDLIIERLGNRRIERRRETEMWPSALPLDDDEMYLIRRASSERSMAVMFKRVPPTLTDHRLAVWLVLTGCEAQAFQLAAQLRQG